MREERAIASRQDVRVDGPEVTAGGGPADPADPADPAARAEGPAVPGGEPAAPAAARRSAMVTGLMTAVGVALLGLPVGLLWYALAPRPAVVAGAGGGLDYVDTESKDFIAGDGTLFLLCLVAGLLAALGVWRLARRCRGAALPGLILGSAAAAVLAWRTGLQLGSGRSEMLLAASKAGRLTGPADLPLELRARQVLLAWPAAAALMWSGRLLRQDRPTAPQDAAPQDAAPDAAPQDAAPQDAAPQDAATPDAVPPGPVSSG